MVESGIVSRCSLRETGRGQDLTSLESVRGSLDKGAIIERKARGRAQSFTSVSSIRGRAEKRTLDEKIKGYKNVVNDMSELSKKTNLVPPGFDPIEDDPLHPRDEVEVMQDMTQQSQTDIEEAKLDHMGELSRIYLTVMTVMTTKIMY